MTRLQFKTFFSSNLGLYDGDFSAFDPFANASATSTSQKPADIDSTLSNLVNNMEIAGKNPAWMAPGTTAAPGWPQNQQGQPLGNSGFPSTTQANPNPFNPFG